MDAMLTLAVDLRDRHVLVVGGGLVAERKVSTLVEAGAKVRLISPDVTPGLRSLWQEGSIRVLLRGFVAGDTAEAMLVVVATGNPQVDSAVAAEAQARQVLVSVSGQPDQGNTHFMAEVRRGPVRIGISTGGSAPSLAKRLQQQVERAVGPEYGQLAELLAEMREQVKALPGLTQPQRAKLLAAMVDGPALGLLARGDVAGARAALAELLRRYQTR